MNLDQKIQIWNAVGTWLAAFGTLAAVGFSLWITIKRDKVRLKVWAGVRVLIPGRADLPTKDVMMIQVTNLGDRAVTIGTIGWRVGKGKKARYCVQIFGDVGSANYPKVLNHGETASFYLGLDGEWSEKMMNDFIKDVGAKNLRSFTAQIETSVGQTVNCPVEQGLLDLLVKHKK